MWLDGSLIAQEDARVPIENRGFLYGDGCFETIRIHGGAPFRLDAHIDRLRSALEVLRIEPPWGSEDLRQGVRKVVEANGVVEGLARITVIAGERRTTRGMATITSRALPEIPSQPALHVAASVRRMSGPLSQVKSISRAAESVALREAEAEGAFDAVLLNEKGRVVETTARNIFLVSGGSLQTPPTYDGALPGITRSVVLQIAARAKIRSQEISISLDRLRDADEVFLSGSGVGVLGIASIDGHRTETPGRVTRVIQDAYATLLDAEAKW
ncbi:MAG TPA: aminotransferase class IV [Thermoplasmata archaeon]|nr:aminotransferase class IV [Thermoplasmata archaeon]